MSLRSDCLLATTGLFPDEITPQEHAAAKDLLPRWERRLRRWVTGDPHAFIYKEPPDLEKMFTRLATPPAEATMHGWIDGLGVGDAELLTDYALPTKGLLRVRDYITNAWPKFSVATPAGPKILPLSEDDANEMWSLIQVLDDPDRMLDEMESLTLTGTQADAFMSCYPDLQAWAVSIIAGEIAIRLAKSSAFDVGSDKEAILATLKGLPPEEPMPQMAPPPQPDKKFEINADLEKTQADVSGEPKARK